MVDVFEEVLCEFIEAQRGFGDGAAEHLYLEKLAARRREQQREWVAVQRKINPTRLRKSQRLWVRAKRAAVRRLQPVRVEETVCPSCGLRFAVVASPRPPGACRKYCTKACRSRASSALYRQRRAGDHAKSIDSEK